MSIDNASYLMGKWTLNFVKGKTSFRNSQEIPQKSCFRNRAGRAGDKKYGWIRGLTPEGEKSNLITRIRDPKRTGPSQTPILNAVSRRGAVDEQ
ncbi:MAG: hypothetical protein ABIK28_04180 [Planctomycetota bacterium]